MPRIRPFAGTTYTSKVAPYENVVAPPYDVISPTEADELYQRHPANIVRLILGKQFDSDTESDSRYTRAANFLQDWKASDLMAMSDKPAFYLYQQVFEWRGTVYSREGIMAAVQVMEYAERGILPHEKTLPKPKADRLNLVRECKANFSPVFCVYTDESKQIDKFSIENRGDLVMEAVQEGVTNRLYAITDPSALEHISSALSDKTLYIADGHHRYETSLKYRNEMREKNPEATGDQPWDYMFMFLVNTHADGMLVLPTHRQVRDLPEEVVSQVGSKLSEVFDITHYEASAKEQFISDLKASAGSNVLGIYGPGIEGSSGNSFALLRPGQGWEARMPSDRAPEWNGLDVAQLHVLLLNGIMGVSLDPGESKKNLDFEVDEDKIVADVDSGAYQFATFLNTTPLASVQEIAGIGEFMPQKSTYFYPKPLSGMVIRELDAPLG